MGARCYLCVDSPETHGSHLAQNADAFRLTFFFGVSYRYTNLQRTD